MDRSLATWVFPAACVLALAMVVGAYSNSFQNSFHFDDNHVIESNLYLRSLKNIPRFFRDASTYSSNPVNAQYRPLVSTTLAIDYSLGAGLKPGQFHASQLAMLVLLGIAVFLLFLRLMNLAGERWWNRWAALLAATLYAVHPTATETLNIIHVRTELLSTLGVAGSFLVYFHFPRGRRAHLYLLPMIVGALAKTPAVMFAPLFLVYLVLFEQELSLQDLLASRSWPAVRKAVGRALPALAVAGVLFLFVEGSNAPTVDMGGGTRMEYLRTQTFMWLHYGRLFFVPAGLTADSDWTLIPHWYDTRVVAGLLFVALLLRILWSTSKVPSQRPVAFGLAWFALALLPASSLFPLAEVTNDHRPFFAYIGLSLAVVWGLALLVERWSEAAPRLRSAISLGAPVLALLVVGGSAAGTYQRNAVFLTEETLWRDVAEKSPNNGRGLMNYGLAQMARARYPEAKALFDRAAVHNPGYATLEVNLGIVTGRMGQAAVAEAHFRRALQLQPGNPYAHSFYARWLAEMGRPGEAILHLRQSISLSPADLDARYQLMKLFANEGRSADLKALALATLAIAPGDPLATELLGGSGGTAMSPPAVAGVETPAGLLDTSLRLYRAGNFQGSIAAARRALELKPGYAEAHNNIAAGLASLGRWDEAIAAAREALRLRPDFPLARNNLAWAEREKGK